MKLLPLAVKEEGERHGMHTLGDFDTIRNYDAIKGVAGQRGSMDGPSPAIEGRLLCRNGGWGGFPDNFC